MLFEVPACMYPVDCCYVHFDNGIFLKSDIMCGEMVQFPFQLSCSKHFQYLAFIMRNELITINMYVRSGYKNQKIFLDLYSKLVNKYKSICWKRMTCDDDVQEIHNDELNLFFDRIQKIWFDPKTGLGYENGKLAYYRSNHVFHKI